MEKEADPRTGLLRLHAAVLAAHDFVDLLPILAVGSHRPTPPAASHVTSSQTARPAFATLFSQGRFPRPHRIDRPLRSPGAQRPQVTAPHEHICNRRANTVLPHKTIYATPQHHIKGFM